MLRKVLIGSVLLMSAANVFAATDAPPGYTKCAQNTGATCSFSGTRQVSLGKSGEFHYGTFTNSVVCSSSNFGGALAGVTSAWCSYAPTTSSTSVMGAMAFTPS